MFDATIAAANAYVTVVLLGVCFSNLLAAFLNCCNALVTSYLTIAVAFTGTQYGAVAALSSNYSSYALGSLARSANILSDVDTNNALSKILAFSQSLPKYPTSIRRVNFLYVHQ